MEKAHTRRCALGAMLLTSVTVLACAAPRQTPEPVPSVVVEPARDTLLETPVAQQRAPVTRGIPYEGAFGPADPPMRVPQPQKPLEPWVRQALDVLYCRYAFPLRTSGSSHSRCGSVTKRSGRS